MAYTPSTLTINNWSVPLSVNTSDEIADLDDTVNAILDTNASSVKNHINTELAKLPTYLTAELGNMYDNLGESMAHKWAEEAEDVYVAEGEYSAHHWAIKTSAFLSGLTATFTELNVLDGITASTAELNVLDGITATTAELNILDGVTATASELNILDGVTATTDDMNKTESLLTGVHNFSTYNPSNISIANTYPAWWMRVGNMVIMGIQFTATITGAGHFHINLPHTPDSNPRGSGVLENGNGNFKFTFADNPSGAYVKVNCYSSTGGFGWFQGILMYKIWGSGHLT